MNRINSIWKVAVISGMVMMTSCAGDAWEDHYSVNSDVPTKTLAQQIESMQDYSKFVQVLKTTKVYDGKSLLNKRYWDLLNESEFMTVWLPDETSIPDSLWDIYTLPYDSEKKDHKKVAMEFVMNHIAHFSHTVGANTNEKVIMLSDKAFKSKPDNIAGVRYKAANLRCKNGLVHELDGKLEYLPSIYEFITTDSEYYDVFGKWFKQYTIREVDEEKSIASGVNSDGEMEYVDSVMIEKSVLLDKFGLIGAEDSDYVVVLPTPELLQTMYDSIKQFFEYSETQPGYDSLQKFYTWDAIMTDMFFNMSESAQSDPVDHVVSTQFSLKESLTETLPYHVFRNPYASDGLFGASIRTVECSNGKIYQVDKWPFEDSLTFRRPVKLEVEDQIYSSDVLIQNRRYVSSTTSVIDISQSGKKDWTISYEMGNNLKGKYYVKFVFYAQEMDPAKDNAEYSVHPIVSYRATTAAAVLWNREIVQKKRRFKDPYQVCKNNVKVDTLVVGPVEFNTCNYMTNQNRVEISLQNDPTSMKTASSTVGLDCIILSPVIE